MRNVTIDPYKEKHKNKKEYHKRNSKIQQPKETNECPLLDEFLFKATENPDEKLCATCKKYGHF